MDAYQFGVPGKENGCGVAARASHGGIRGFGGRVRTRESCSNFAGRRGHGFERTAAATAKVIEAAVGRARVNHVLGGADRAGEL